MTMIRFKVCCMQDEAEVRLALRYGASALGFVSAMPSGLGIVDEERIAPMLRLVPPGATSVLLTSLTDADGLIAQHGRCPANCIQLVDHVTTETIRAVRGALPGIGLMPVVHVVGEESIAEAREIAPHADAILLDSGNPSLKVKELGGTGRVHDWSISRRIVEAVSCPVFLAGGLRPDNAREAIAAVNPYGLDICSGLRTTEGRLVEEKLAAFVAAIQ